MVQPIIFQVLASTNFYDHFKTNNHDEHIKWTVDNVLRKQTHKRGNSVNSPIHYTHLPEGQLRHLVHQERTAITSMNGPLCSHTHTQLQTGPIKVFGTMGSLKRQQNANTTKTSFYMVYKNLSKGSIMFSQVLQSTQITGLMRRQQQG